MWMGPQCQPGQYHFPAPSPALYVVLLVHDNLDVLHAKPFDMLDDTPLGAIVHHGNLLLWEVYFPCPKPL
jgi:hypothetical protein